MRDIESTDTVSLQTNHASELLKQNASLKKPREHLLSSVSFERLRELQEEIFAATEMTPSFRKLINALITDSNLQALKKILLAEIGK